MNILNWIWTRSLATLRLTIALVGLVFCYAALELGLLLFRDKVAWKHQMRLFYLRVFIYPIFNLKIEVTGVDHVDTCVYVSNHRSFIDPAILVPYIQYVNVVAKAEVEKYPIFGPAVRDTGVIFVERENKKSRSEVKNQIDQSLKEQQSVLIFPEGTVSGQDHTLAFRYGAFQKAIDNQVAAVPLCIIFKHRSFYWYKQSLLYYYFQSFGRWKVEAKLIIGDPYFGDNDKLLAEACQAWVNAQVDAHESWIEN